MASSGSFREALSSGNIGQALTIALSEVIELEITTWVSEDSATPPSDEEDEDAQPLPGKRMYTRINIVEGDIENEIGREFIDGSYSKLREFHLQEVERGIGIIRQNLDNLQQLFGTLSHTMQELNQLARSRAAAPPATPPLIRGSNLPPRP
jgi:hypothetical protein